MAYALNVNGEIRQVEAAEGTPLLWVLRDILGLRGAKFGCGLCGACTVLIDGEPMRSCSLPAEAVGDSEVITIEGMSAHPIGRRVQAAWTELDVAQCGYCQPGQIVSAVGLLSKTPAPDDADIAAAMQGNLCRCGTYTRIRAAIKRASGGER
jgi:isoquinoline 1-oxidoreductase alpha subunit